MAEYKTYNIIANGVISPITDDVSFRKFITDAIEEQFVNKLDTNILIFDRKEENVGTNNASNILYFKIPGENNAVGFKIIIQNYNPNSAYYYFLAGIYSLNDENPLSFLLQTTAFIIKISASGTAATFEAKIVTVENDKMFVMAFMSDTYLPILQKTDIAIMIVKISGTNEYAISAIGNGLPITCYRRNSMSAITSINTQKKIQISNSILIEKVLLKDSTGLVVNYFDDLVMVYAEALETSNFLPDAGKAIIKSDGHTYTKLRGCVWIKD